MTREDSRRRFAAMCPQWAALCDAPKTDEQIAQAEDCLAAVAAPVQPADLFTAPAEESK